MSKTTAVLALLITPAFGASFHSPPRHGPDKPAPGRGDLAAPLIVFESGPQAQSDMNAVANAVLDWHTLGGCNIGPDGSAACRTNQTLNIPNGPDTLFATVTTPQNLGIVRSNGLTTYNYIDLHFSQPVAGVGLTITDGYRFTWTVGLEAFGVDGSSLGKIEQSGYDQIQAPAVFAAALAQSDLISSVRFYTTNTGAGCPGCFVISSVQIHEAPEPSTLALIGAGLIFIAFWSRRTWQN